MGKYTIGIDYGTLSARALLVDIENGKECAQAEFIYPHAILGISDINGGKDDPDFALQHPADYADALKSTVTEILKNTGIAPSDIVALGIDFTSSTVMPTDDDGTPLCFSERFEKEPHAYVKLWKHHGAAREAEEITALAAQRHEKWLARYGGKVSSEWLFSKLYETLNKAPDVYRAASHYLEAADWLVLQLTGKYIASACMAGYKALWNKKDGYPSNDFWRELHPEMGNIIGTKICENVLPTGSLAGHITEKGAQLSGLCVGTCVTVPVIDAHAALPSTGVVTEGDLSLIIGTSSCHIVLGKKDIAVPGICGSVEDGVIEGFVAFEAGQTGVGDTFDWFVKNCVPEKYSTEARESGKDIFTYLTEKAEKYEPGESGVIALDWWNGNRTPYADTDLSGMILGLTLATRPEEIYRALIESCAYGTKSIINLYRNHGVAVNSICASGGISQKNSFLMQIYSDVLGMDIRVTECTQAGAKGSSVYAAAASGYYASVSDAAKVLADKCEKVYHPNPLRTEKYAELFEEYVRLCEYFAKDNKVMKLLKRK